MVSRVNSLEIVLGDRESGKALGGTLWASAMHAVERHEVLLFDVAS